MTQEPGQRRSARLVLLLIIALMVCGTLPGLIIFFSQPSPAIIDSLALISVPAFLLTMPLALILVLISHVYRRLAIAAIFVTLIANAYFGLPTIT